MIIKKAIKYTYKNIQQPPPLKLHLVTVFSGFYMSTRRNKWSVREVQTKLWLSGSAGYPRGVKQRGVIHLLSESPVQALFDFLQIRFPIIFLGAEKLLRRFLLSVSSLPCLGCPHLNKAIMEQKGRDVLWFEEARMDDSKGRHPF